MLRDFEKLFNTFATFQIVRFQIIKGHPWIRAIADVDHHGVILRGIKLEQHPEGWRVVAPGRRVDGTWQKLFSFTSRAIEEGLLALMMAKYKEVAS